MLPEESSDLDLPKIFDELFNPFSAEFSNGLFHSRRRTGPFQFHGGIFRHCDTMANGVDPDQKDHSGAL